MIENKRKILFVCTTGRDRSGACVQIFEAFAPDNMYLCCGINKWTTSQNNTILVSNSLLDWATDIVCMEDIHKKIILERHGNEHEYKIKVLELGDWDFKMKGINYTPEHAIKSTITLLNKVNNLINIK